MIHHDFNYSCFIIKDNEKSSIYDKTGFYIANIIARHLSGEITPEESVQLESWRKEDSAHEALFQKICSKENLKNMWRKVCHLMSQPAGWKYKSVLGKAITGNG